MKFAELPEATGGFVLMLRRLVVERLFDAAARFRRLALVVERFSKALASLQVVAFGFLSLHNPVPLFV